MDLKVLGGVYRRVWGEKSEEENDIIIIFKIKKKVLRLKLKIFLCLKFNKKN